MANHQNTKRLRPEHNAIDQRISLYTDFFTMIRRAKSIKLLLLDRIRPLGHLQ